MLCRHSGISGSNLILSIALLSWLIILKNPYHVRSYRLEVPSITTAPPSSAAVAAAAAAAPTKGAATTTTTTVKCDKRILYDCDHYQYLNENYCYFDTERYCFKHFYTKCRMQAYACHYDKELILYGNKFCDLVQFLCNEDIADYHWPPEHFDQQIAAMYKKKYENENNNRQQSQQQKQYEYFLNNSTFPTLPLFMKTNSNKNIIK